MLFYFTKLISKLISQLYILGPHVWHGYFKTKHTEPTSGIFEKTFKFRSLNCGSCFEIFAFSSLFNRISSD